MRNDQRRERHRRGELIDKDKNILPVNMDRELEKIKKYKELNKNHVLQKIINSVLTCDTTITTHFGKTEIVAFEF